MQQNNRNTPNGSAQKPGFESPLNQYTQQPKQEDQDNPFYKSAAPTISLPKGGGALKGIDEKFSVNAVNGTAGMDIPLPLTPGRGGFSPALSLSYNSGSGNSEFGLGWGLGLPAIQRKTDKKLPQYNDAEESDVFLLAGAEDLVPELDAGGNPIIITSGNYTIKRYRPRIEGLFARIELIVKTGKTSSWWRVTTKDNITTYYGLTTEGRITNPQSNQQIYKWLPDLVLDHKGNVQRYHYKKEDGLSVPELLHEKNRTAGTFTNTYLKSIQYCNKTPWETTTGNCYDPSLDLPLSNDFLMEAVLDYGDHSNEYIAEPDQDWPCRKDAFSDYHAGFEIRTYRKCKRIMMFHNFTELEGHHLIRTLELTYEQDTNPAILTEADFIKSAIQRGYEYKSGAWHNKALPAMTFNYEPLQWDTKVQSVARKDFQGAPQGLTGPYQWTDFEGEGISGILTEQGTGWFYKSNLGDGHFAPPVPIAQKPSFQGLGNQLQWQDLDADGRRQVVTDGQVKGFWELDDSFDSAQGAQNWQRFQPFAKNTNIDKSSPFTKMLDLDGDGKADILVTEDRVWTWYQNEGKQGFDKGGTAPIFRDEEKGPVLLLRDKVQSIFLADMSGDGMTDLVRIKNGEVCYWPNMGYGKFGAKVALLNAPHFHNPQLFNPAYLTLADISGTGAADLIYLGKHNKCTAWLNLSGNGFSEAKGITPMPGTDQYSKIAILDFLGNGTGCMVWSSPLPQYANAPIRYIDLMGGKKPYLMKSYSNGMGKTVSVTYKSSTQFYLADKLSGKPWATKLPFPVQCIEKITTHDAVSDTTYTQTYKYRHGYYDHEEREFRGFGYVETQDIDSAATSINTHLDQKPVLTKTWNHTGAWMREQTLLDAFKKEYYQFEGWDDVTVIADFPTGLNPQEQREAYRGLKGSPLRQEVYALDASPLQHIPYSVTASAYTVKRIQKQGRNRHASFINQPLQSVAFSCERNPDDPRIMQQLTLETDEYGNVLRSVAIAYPRKHADTDLPAKVQEEQAKMHITYTRNAFTNDAIDTHHYRLRLPAEAKTYEVLGLQTPTALWTLQSWNAAFTSVIEIDFSANATGAKEQRLLSHVRSLYKHNTAANSPMGWYELESLAIPHEQYQLAFTTALLAHCYNGLVTTAMLEEGGYVAIDGKYWLPSGKAFYVDATLSTTLKQRFYTPLYFEDPWNNKTTITYWGYYWMLPESVKDAKDNISTVESYDWRILQPTRMKDANLNISVILYDTLGMPIAMAAKGKDNHAIPEGDSLDSIDIYSLTDSEAQIQFFADDPEVYANVLLKDATWRCVYDLNHIPASVGMIARQQHVHNPVVVAGQGTEHLVRISYSDSMGRIIMHKAQCEGIPSPVGGTEGGQWIGSGRTIYNNKGNVVMQFEPYFSSTHQCDTAEQAANLGISPKMFYDPLNRVYRTEMPDGTFSKTEWTAWEQSTFDSNDTVMDSQWYQSRIGGVMGIEEEKAAIKAAAHYNTPTVVHTDSLARPFYTIQQDSTTSYIHSYAELDIVGNRIAVIDGNRINTTPLIKTLQYRYNLLKQVCRQDSIDGGTNHVMIDVAGQPLYAWDADGRNFFMEYDALRRVLRKWLDHTQLQEEMIYGEGQPNDTGKNLRGQLYEHRDSAGKQWIPDGYDFKGLPLQTKLCLIADKTVTDTSWTTPPMLSSETFTTAALVDALGRPVLITDAGGNITTHIYDRGGALKTVKLGADTYVQDIHYDAKGQRQAIWYGNGTKTNYTYDPLNYRLTQLQTIRLSDNEKVQELKYWYDAVGNITQITDNVQPIVFHDNTVIRPEQKYTYDALYRLIKAKGRELKGNTTGEDADNYNDAALMTNAASPFDGNALQNYTQHYTYDAVGNILTLKHCADVGGYTRTFSYDNNSNRLHSTTVGTHDPYEYLHDTRGNITEMPHLDIMNWNDNNQLCNIRRGTSMEAWYQYSGGQRIRKYIVKDGMAEERIYLGSYEIYRKFDHTSSLTLERTTVHISDDTGRISMLEVKTVDTEGDLSPASLKRFIYSNHLQSAGLELDDSGAVISYEEYHPYGTTAYQAVDSTVKAAAKRYRYTGKERDEESGLNYHGARYYALWLCRWVSVDPLESKYAPQSPFAYCSNKPTMRTDPSGMGDDPKDKNNVGSPNNPNANEVAATTKVTPEVAGSILGNTINGQNGFIPSKGKGGASWFVSNGNPYTGSIVDASKTVGINTVINKEGAIQFSSQDLMGIFNRIRNDKNFINEIEAEYRNFKGLSADGALSNTVQKKLNTKLDRAAESRMWDEVAKRVSASESGVGEVSLINSDFSKSGNGKFLVVTNPNRIKVSTDSVMVDMHRAGLSVESYTKNALDLIAKDAKSAGLLESAAKVRSAFRIGGKILTVIGISNDAYRLYNATDKWKTGTEIAGGWAGGMAAAGAFTSWFLPADSAGPITWALHGIGALAAFSLGYHYGAMAAKSIYEITVQGLSKGTDFSGFRGGTFGGAGAGGPW